MNSEDPLMSRGQGQPIGFGLFTSRDVSDMAYESTKKKRPRVESLIITELNKSPKTDDELEVVLDMRHQTVSACRRSLVKRGVVEATGDLRKTRSGRQAQVWRMKERT